MRAVLLALSALCTCVSAAGGAPKPAGSPGLLLVDIEGQRTLTARGGWLAGQPCPLPGTQRFFSDPPGSCVVPPPTVSGSRERPFSVGHWDADSQSLWLSVYEDGDTGCHGAPLATLNLTPGACYFTGVYFAQVLSAPGRDGGVQWLAYSQLPHLAAEAEHSTAEYAQQQHAPPQLQQLQPQPAGGWGTVSGRAAGGGSRGGGRFAALRRAATSPLTLLAIVAAAVCYWRARHVGTGRPRAKSLFSDSSSPARRMSLSMGSPYQLTGGYV